MLTYHYLYLQRFSLENCKNLNGLLLKNRASHVKAALYPNFENEKWTQSQHQIIFDPVKGVVFQATDNE